MAHENYERFGGLTFDAFKKLASDNSLSCYEKIGFPDSYREGREGLIFQSFLTHCPLLTANGKKVLDIGPGCSQLPHTMIDWCRQQGHELLLIDSLEMLAHLPDEEFVRKFAGYYPQCDALFEEYRSKLDVIVAYSVLHYVFVEGNIWDFLDRSLELLAEGGQMLLGDIPNISKRKRFFSSRSGVRYHQEFTQSQSVPDVHFNRIERQQIDDSVVLAIIHRARSQGFDAYLVPQPPELPMANRREDVLIRRP